MSQNIDLLDHLMTRAPVIPVLILEDPEKALGVGRALVAGGLPVLEVTLRTARAYDCIRALSTLEGAIVGAGTVLDGLAVSASVEAGAQFLVSPGTSPKLLDAVDRAPVPLLPGVATATEAMALMERGYERMKFFPAEAVGGTDHLKALASPLPRLRFCPTGGIGPEKASRYLALPNVVCVGGSWVTPADAIAAGDWDRIERLAREAANLGAAC
ncbi:MAG: bifunctional 4-hydroxy-2-oxoglutarate aldolase/2-dehydro-3-deoxy-phosphogluconate aldolase [Phyllobacteriaceae bacterium]|nr:bifunctional 4-hydroxy-2-oxoglutarate aldolase/2-dehydro-3-deoxy-phosphogluconate aldolase [Phyllobacteriaceae bacterium]